MHFQAYVYIIFVYRVVYVDMSTRSSQLNHLDLSPSLSLCLSVSSRATFYHIILNNVKPYISTTIQICLIYLMSKLHFSTCVQVCCSFENVYMYNLSSLLGPGPLFGRGLDVKNHTSLFITLVDKHCILSLSLLLFILKLDFIPPLSIAFSNK